MKYLVEHYEYTGQYKLDECVLELHDFVIDAGDKLKIDGTWYRVLDARQVLSGKPSMPTAKVIDYLTVH